jgi:tyrosyl-tRNA synthetase
MENLSKIGYKVRAHLTNTMVPGPGAAGKMSASEPDSKIDILDSPEDARKKLKKQRMYLKRWRVMVSLLLLSILYFE